MDPHFSMSGQNQIYVLSSYFFPISAAGGQHQQQGGYDGYANFNSQFVFFEK